MQKNPNIEKTAFKFVQMKFLAMHFTNQKLSFDTRATYDLWLCGPGSHIRMIFEGSCDTEDWSNDAENIYLPSQE